ncbi:DUF1902 domain-containing protein [Mesorhizobium prunaredense]
MPREQEVSSYGSYEEANVWVATSDDIPGSRYRRKRNINATWS